ncbi:MAG: nucleotidyltransferase family protein [Rhodocyclaceae bacterium]|nr:nucleotidyltransferase family protein [Rhodocyclaceae bacterium]
MTLPVAILAGGLATRLRPITETIPKSLVDVAGKPFVVRQLEYLRAQQLERVVLCVGHLGEMIHDVVGDGTAWGLRVSYSYDGERLAGTGGALRKALPALGSSFFVLYGDSYLPIEYARVEACFMASGQPALMTIMANSNQWDKSNVLFRDGRLVEYNKREPKEQMAHIDYGLGVLSASTLEPYPENQAFDLADLYQRLSVAGQLAGFEVHQRFYEIGSHSGLRDAESYFNRQESP